MPTFLKFIVSTGTITPIVVLASLLLGTDLTQFQINGVVIGCLSFCVTFIWISSYFFLKRKKLSRILWLVSWGLLVLSSLFPVVGGTPANKDIGARLVTDVVMGILIGIYLFKSKAVKRYLEGARLGGKNMEFGLVGVVTAQLDYILVFWRTCKMRFIKMLGAFLNS
jgi:hypothetical protein